MRVLDLCFVEEGCFICRRCECEECYYCFIIFEKVEEFLLIVVKKDGVREEFSKDKIFWGLIKVCEKC